MINPAEIPGYAAAIESERTNRELSFLAQPLPLCGVAVRQMTPRHMLLLKGVGNRFVTGGRPDAGDVSIFVWLLSMEYTTGHQAQIAFCKKLIKGMNVNKSIGEVFRFLEMVFQDAPEGTSQDKLYTAPIASLVDRFASQYGWTTDEILEQPLARLFQLSREITRRFNPQAPMCNKSDRYIGEWLTRQNEKIRNQ